MSGTLHVVGAGLAGLAAAVAGARAGWHIALHEAAPQAGGRCRSFHCPRLDRMIDNGSHLLLGANRHALAFARTIGGAETLESVDPAFPFLDLANRRHWVVQPNKLAAGVWETAKALGLPRVPAGQTVGRRLGACPAYGRLWRPLCEAILNTSPEHASARLLACVLREVLLGGKTSMRPYLATAGLSALFAAPAVATLAAYGARLHFGRRLTAIRSNALDFDDGSEAIGPGDRAVLAVSPWIASSLLPGLPDLPTAAIVNAHFRLPQAAVLAGGQPFLGLVGGTAQWLFVRDDVVSVTVSAADHLAEQPAEDIAARLWREVAPVVQADPARLPPARVIKERRATLAHTPEAVARRPGPATNVPWLWLAGDWLAAPWPCTMEAAVASGLAATRLAVGRDGLAFA
ncbi:MAG: FAD-dependent oxidoreductase [Bacteroidales bacterium]